MKLADFHIPGRLRATLETLAPVVCPPDVHTLGITADIIASVELLLRSFPTYIRVGLVAGIGAFEVGALPSHLRRFSRLDEPRARAYFESWWHSPLPPMRLFAKVLKGLLAMGYYEQPAVHDRIGYHPDQWHQEIRRRRAPHVEAAARHLEVVLAPDPLVPASHLNRRVPDGQAS